MSALREILAHFSVKFDDAELKKGNEAVKSAIDGVKSFAQALGIGLGLKAMLDFAKASADQAVTLDRQAAAMRISAEELQRWQQAAQIAGSSSEAITSALDQMRMRSRKPTEALMQVADRLTAIKDPTRRAQMGTALLGNSYLELEPLLAKGSKGIRENIRQAEDLAEVFSKDTVQAAKESRAELGKLNVFYDGLKTQLGAAVIPMLTSLLKRIVPVAMWFRSVSKNTQLFRATTMALVGGGLFKAINALGGLRKILQLVSRQVMTTLLPLFMLEDILTFLGGGKSAFGEILDKIFGKGKAEKVRKEFAAFLEDLKTKPMEAVNRLLSWFGLDPTSKWKGFFESFVVTLKAVIDAFGGGWEGAKKLFGVAWDGIILIAEIAWTELKFGFLHLAAIVGDAFADMWNGIVGGAQGTVRFLSKAAGALGANDTAKALAESAKSLELNKSDANSASVIERARDADRLKIAERADVIGQRFNTNNNSTQTTIDAKQSIVVNVPSGTTEQVANRVANATSKAIQKNNQATRAALVPGQG